MLLFLLNDQRDILTLVEVVQHFDNQLVDEQEHGRDLPRQIETLLNVVQQGLVIEHLQDLLLLLLALELVQNVLQN